MVIKTSQRSTEPKVDKETQKRAFLTDSKGEQSCSQVADKEAQAVTQVKPERCSEGAILGDIDDPRKPEWKGALQESNGNAFLQKQFPEVTIFAICQREATTIWLF